MKKNSAKQRAGRRPPVRVTARPKPRPLVAVKKQTRRKKTTAAIAPRWSWHYATLFALRNRLARDSAAKLREAAGPIEPHGMHLADSASDEFDHDLALTLLARDGNAMTEVDDALARIRQGRYGVCEETGKRIPARRLRAIPWCRYTRETEERFEKSGAIRPMQIPAAVSVRGPQPLIPGPGKRPRQGADETAGATGELEEPELSRLVDGVSAPGVAEMEEARPPTKSATRRTRS